LAREKALAVSRLHQGALVIGADQVLDCEGEIFHKAKDRGEALEKLRALSGKTHSLHSAAAVAMDGAVLWAGREEARLTMRSLSEGDLRDYAGRAGEALTACAGGYAIEEAGAWLFERVEGDHFIIQGLPLLPLLGFLKSQYSF
jgi:septum formation protein